MKRDVSHFHSCSWYFFIHFPSPVYKGLAHDDLLLMMRRVREGMNHVQEEKESEVETRRCETWGRESFDMRSWLTDTLPLLGFQIRHFHTRHIHLQFIFRGHSHSLKRRTRKTLPDSYFCVKAAHSKFSDRILSLSLSLNTLKLGTLHWDQRKRHKAHEAATSQAFPEGWTGLL